RSPVVPLNLQKMSRMPQFLTDQMGKSKGHHQDFGGSRCPINDIVGTGLGPSRQ
ncbi:hypothetical protein CISIN_1g0463852mg, partial [Citrus sinensis]